MRAKKESSQQKTWWTLVREIAAIEELIAENPRPSNPKSIWALHLMESNLKIKRHMLSTLK